MSCCDIRVKANDGEQSALFNLQSLLLVILLLIWYFHPSLSPSYRIFILTHDKAHAPTSTKSSPPSSTETRPALWVSFGSQPGSVRD